MRECIAYPTGFGVHTIDLIWETFQWIPPLYMKPISFQSKAAVVCLVPAAIFIDFCLKKLNVFSQHIGKENQMNIWIPQNKSTGIEILINFLCLLLPEILLNNAASTYCEKVNGTHEWATQALLAPISSLSLLFVQTQAARCKAATPEQLTGAHLYLDIAKSGYLFHSLGNVMPIPRGQPRDGWHVIKQRFCFWVASSCLCKKLMGIYSI